jgi:putative flavoprotein involved in K+ transport
MSDLYDTIVIGAGQAGLASAYYLKRARSRFLVLDGGGQIGESWLRRWDSLRLFTPVRYNSLPGLPFPGERYALPVKDAVARYLESYVGHFALPVRLNTRVSSLVRGADGFVIRADRETLTARSVVVATGAYHRPYIPAFASALSPSLVQMHSSEYRNPDALPPGSVLVVGAGNSGAQIALELAQSGRPTWLSGRDTGAIPRRVLGRDVYDWLWWTVMRASVDSWVGRRLMGRLFAGDPLVGFSRRALMIPALTSVSRTVGVSNGHPRLDDGRVLEDVRTVVWCTGFRPDFRWIQLPVFGPDGYPEHRRGIVAAAPGLGFVGLRYQYRIGSSLIGGVGEDAEYVVTRETNRPAAFARRAEPRPSGPDAGGDVLADTSGTSSGAATADYGPVQPRESTPAVILETVSEFAYSFNQLWPEVMPRCHDECRCSSPRLRPTSHALGTVDRLSRSNAFGPFCTSACGSLLMKRPLESSARS